MKIDMAATNPLRALGRFIATYWFWILCLAALNGAVWAGAACVYLPRLWAHQAALWSVRMSVVSGLLLFDNLCVLWWYADSTKELVVKANEQLAIEKAKYAESQRHLLVSLKPVVYTERVEDPKQQGYAHYGIRNAGGGPAVNVYYIALVDLLFGDPVSLGALAAGDMRALPAGVGDTLRERHAGLKYVLIAEAPYTRTTQWIPMLNIRTSAMGRHRGQVLSRTAEPAIDPPRFQYQKLADYFANNRERFAEQLMAFSNEEAAE